MSLSKDSTKRLFIAVTDEKSAGPEIVDAINQGAASSAADVWPSPAAITAAHTSTTTDFAALQVGDLVVHVPATAGNSQFGTVATAGTLPFAAVVGDLYMVFRKFVAPASVAGVVKL